MLDPKVCSVAAAARGPACAAAARRPAGFSTMASLGSDVFSSDLHAAMDLPFALDVRKVDGTAQSVSVRPSTSVGDVKVLLAKQTDAATGDSCRTTLLFAGRELSDLHTLSTVGVTPHDFVVAVSCRPKKRRRVQKPQKRQQQQQQQPPATVGWSDHGRSCTCEQCTTTAPPSMPAKAPAATPGAAFLSAPPPPRPPKPAVIRTTVVTVSRRPVILLWAAAVAFRLGHGRDLSLSMAGAVASVFSQLKAKHLGINMAKNTREGEMETSSGAGTLEVLQLMTQPVTVERMSVDISVTPSGIIGRAYEPAIAGETLHSKIVAPAHIWTQIERGFGASLPAAYGAFMLLAASLSKETLEEGTVPYSLYERFRPKVPSGTQGWGASAKLDLGLVMTMRDEARAALAADRVRQEQASTQQDSGGSGVEESASAMRRVASGALSKTMAENVG
eukprot:COSAG05_NODE_2435_length_3067_cov_14.528976_2_plen_446_part_00